MKGIHNNVLQLENSKNKNHSEIALELMIDGYYDKAIEYFKKALEEDPQNYELWYHLGNSYTGTHEYTKAIKCYERVLQLNSDFQEGYLSLGEVYGRIGRRKKAKKIIKEGLKKFENTEYFYFSSIILTDCGEYKLAEKLIKKALNKNYRESYLVVLGNVYFGMGKVDDALEYYNRALELNPNNEETWNNKGFLLYSEGRYTEAIECYNKALKINPNYKEAWYNRGYTYHTSGKLKKAVADYWFAIKIDPKDEVLWNNLGNALYNIGKYMESIPYFMKAVSINPNYEIGWNNIGNALNRMGMHELSIPFHDKALSINPKFDYAWYAKGHALCELGKYEESLEFLERAIDLNSKYGETWYWRGFALYKLERYEEAIESLKIAVNLDAGLVSAFELMGDIYALLGYNVESLKYYEMGLKNGDSNDKARIYIKMGRYGEALNISDNETKARILYKLGRYNEILTLKGGMMLDYIKCLALEAMGKYEEAFRLIEKFSGDIFERERKFISFLIKDEGFELDKNDIEYQIRVGAVLLELGEYEKALKLFKDIKTRESYYLLGESYLALGEVNTAKRYLEIAVGLGHELALERLMEVNKNEKISYKKKRD